MGLAEWAAVLAHALIATALGYGALRTARLPPGRLPDAPSDAPSLIFDWSTCFLAGQLVLYVLTVATIAVPVTHATMLPAVVLLALAAAVAWARRAGPERIRRGLLGVAGTVLLVAALFPNHLAMAHLTPVFEWDARSIWMFHGKGLYHGGRVDAAFFGDPLYWWSSPDYPVLLPAQAAWCSLLIGRWSDVGCKAFLWFQFVAWFRLLQLLFAARGLPWWLGVFTAIAFVIQGSFVQTWGLGYSTGQADHHYAVPLVLTALALTQPGPRQVPFAALMLAYAANVKNEAAAYVALLLVVLVVTLLVRARGELRAVLAAASAWRSTIVFAAIVGALPLLLWKVFVMLHPVPGGLDLVQQLPHLGERLLQRAGTIAAAFGARAVAGGVPWLLGAWLLTFVVGAAMARTPGLQRRDALVAAAVAVVLGLIFTTYVLTPHDLAMHLDTALTRLLIFPQLLVFVLVVFRLEFLVQVVGARSRGRVLAPDA